MMRVARRLSLSHQVLVVIIRINTVTPLVQI